MQHDCIQYRLEGLNGLEGEGADFKIGRGRTYSVLAQEREMHKGKRVVLGPRHLYSPYAQLLTRPSV